MRARVVGWWIGAVWMAAVACGSRFQHPNPTTGPSSAAPSGIDNSDRPNCGACGQAFADEPEALPSIAWIQGRAQRSELEGQNVDRVVGIVTGVRTNGFFVETPDAEQDTETATSEGIYVYTRSAPDVRVGDRVSVRGIVSEYVSAASSEADLPRTEITDPVVEVLGHGEPLPAAVVLGGADRPIPDRVAASGIALDPAANALDFFESLEGMRVEVRDALVVGALHGATVAVVAESGRSLEARTVAGGLALTESDPNPERIIIDTSALSEIAPVDVGARLDAPVTGILDYQSGRYVVLADGTWPDVAPSGFARGGATLASDDAHWTIASFNAHNLSPTDRDHMRAVGSFIVDSLNAPDVVALEEVEDQNGTATGELDATGTLDALCAAIVRAGGPEYHFTQIAPAGEDADGGAHGSNIRVAYLYRADRVVSTTSGNAGANDAVAVSNDHGRARFAPIPGRIAPTEPAFADCRKPLVAEFWRGTSRIVAIAVHLSSRLGDDPVFGAVQPPRSPSSERRRAQAEVIAGFVQRIESIEPDAPLVVLGDFNDYEYSPALATLDAVPLSDVTALLPAPVRYSYVYEGNAQLFDHVLVSEVLTRRTEAGIVHANADFADVERCSDHDAVLARVAMTP